MNIAEDDVRLIGLALLVAACITYTTLSLGGSTPSRPEAAPALVRRAASTSSALLDAAARRCDSQH